MSSNSISQALWAQRIPLIVTHTSAPTTPFITSVPRYSYLALLLPRLSLFFRLPCSSFHHEDVLLRNLAVGLLADLYQPTLPWRLTVSDGVSWDIGDTFLNSVKEVCSRAQPQPSYALLPKPSVSMFASVMHDDLTPYSAGRPTLSATETRTRS